MVTMGKKSTARAAAVAQFLATAADVSAYAVPAPGDSPDTGLVSAERLWTRESSWHLPGGTTPEEKTSFKIVVPVDTAVAERVFEVTVREVKP